MPRLTNVDPLEATGKAKELLDAVQDSLGVTPNMTRTMATAPALLEGYLGLSGALGAGLLPASLRERIALAVAQYNECGYCLAAHSYIGTNMAGLSNDDVAAARGFTAEDDRIAAVLRFAVRILDSHGGVADTDLDAIRAAGYGDAEIAEIVGHVALNVLTNYFNRLGDVEVDFPAIAARAATRP